ncbi:plasmid pRiA4b ORF-3 family protein [Variovorax ureilyticus]|uniref:Plasmid pRiA4b ORF-3 family protein n=1 Tax=Variovorax ureilyticus TaxID=1836198 RepID=A0ABU8VLZ8_9BURK
MKPGASSGREVLQLCAVLRGISPLIWRRLLVRGDTSVARLHQVLQVAFGWQDMHLHRFEIRGREYGVHQEGGVFFYTDTPEIAVQPPLWSALADFAQEWKVCLPHQQENEEFSCGSYPSQSKTFGAIAMRSQSR